MLAYRIFKWLIFILFYLTTAIPGILLMCLTCGHFNYEAIFAAVQRWAEIDTLQ